MKMMSWACQGTATNRASTPTAIAASPNHRKKAPGAAISRAIIQVHGPRS
jgi:hypothetical protein